MKKIFSLILLSIFLISFGQAQDKVNDIRQKYKKIVAGAGYKTYNPEVNCNVNLRVSEKDGEVRLIEVSGGEEGFSYTTQYFYWDSQLIFVFSETCYASDDFDTDNTIYCYEFRHYYDYFWIKSLYKGYKYEAGTTPPNAQNIDFYDDTKAYQEKENADYYLEIAKNKNWSKLCE